MVNNALPRISAESIFLRGSDNQSLQSRLLAGIVGTILEGRNRPGTKMPGTRELAASANVSRMTVTLVYQELVSLGYIESRPRSGFVVSDSVPTRRVSGSGDRQTAPSQISWQAWLGDIAPRERVIRKPENWRDYRYPFIFGQADPRLFDLNAWRDCARRTFSARDFAELAVDMLGQDDPMLLDYICSNTLPRRGIQASRDEVLITVGSQNGLYLALDLLARDGRPSALENPGYPDFAETLRRFNASLNFVPVDDGGMDPEAIPVGTRLVVVTPSHNIPTGATMPMARRNRLLERAGAEDFLVIEDDYDFEMSYLSPPLPSLKSMDGNGRVIYLGSFSKSLFPGLRLGYMVAPAPLIAAAREARAIMLRHPSTHLQRITAYFLALGHYDAHIVRLRQEMKLRRAALIDALRDTPFKIAGASREGGTSLWIAAPDRSDSDALAARARKSSVLIEPGAVFFDSPPENCHYFRMGYGSIDKRDIADGLKLLVDCL